MWGNRNAKKPAKINTLVGRGALFRGNIEFSGGLHIDGTVYGNITAVGDENSILSLSEGGVIEGDIHVPHVMLNGSVKGDVVALEHVDLGASARIRGNVYYKLIEMARGAEVNGGLVRRDESAPALIAHEPSTAATLES